MQTAQSSNPSVRRTSSPLSTLQGLLLVGAAAGYAVATGLGAIAFAGNVAVVPPLRGQVLGALPLAAAIAGLCVLVFGGATIWRRGLSQAAVVTGLSALSLSISWYAGYQSGAASWWWTVLVATAPGAVLAGASLALRRRARAAGIAPSRPRMLLVVPPLVVSATLLVGAWCWGTMSALFYATALTGVVWIAQTLLWVALPRPGPALRPDSQ